MDSHRAPAVSCPFADASPMRTAVLTLVLTAAFAAPVSAQVARADAPRPAPVALYDETPATPSAPVTLGRLFNAQTLRFSQSVEMSYDGGAGGALGMGVYTAGVQWQPSSRLAARVDVGVARDLFSTGAVASALGPEAGQPRVFLRNAEIAYRPTTNTLLQLSVQQSPYGAYASPYGAGYGGVPLGGASRYRASFGSPDADRLFFRDGQ